MAARHIPERRDRIRFALCRDLRRTLPGGEEHGYFAKNEISHNSGDTAFASSPGNVLPRRR
jgi:hypothetical protein